MSYFNESQLEQSIIALLQERDSVTCTIKE